jgi:SnoaL-like domain
MTAAMGPSPDDRNAIEDLYHAYLWALDTGDTDGYVATFHADASVIETTPEGIREARGREEIRRWLVEDFHGDPRFPGHQHVQENLRYEPDPDGRPDHWRVRAYCRATTFRGDPPVADLFWCGHCDDIVARRNGAWRLLRRGIYPWAGEVLSRFTASA